MDSDNSSWFWRDPGRLRPLGFYRNDNVHRISPNIESIVVRRRIPTSEASDLSTTTAIHDELGTEFEVTISARNILSCNPFTCRTMEKTLARILGLSHTPQRSLREYADFLTGFPACQALSAPGTCSVPRGFFMKEQLCLVREALSMIWYHSLYPWHCSKAYTQFMVDEDYEQPEAVKAYNRESWAFFR